MAGCHLDTSKASRHYRRRRASNSAPQSSVSAQPSSGAFGRFIGDPLCAGLDGFDRQAVQQPKTL
jgi:hypothetical protein